MVSVSGASSEMWMCLRMIRRRGKRLVEIPFSVNRIPLRSRAVDHQSQKQSFRVRCVPSGGTKDVSYSPTSHKNPPKKREFD
ncbi:uncharacterized protein TRIVIDRAFT_186112 [Trichoderma virens Gv29-8]|uniref:Uncharacterized protein n=1 Tax=Hypocrea virens (strain Gv29-8 / FGSC 10586) TaxID=413071 RepID=G9MLA2_HYPVG|nr:uncharacterized protein TRIVIDRAFT_186112 [Trichoderma virens Gv29-8]EHK24993.1 hypothetical protein TRIVIDRAFT_186112 [Trichoderma virens Gv29-8]